MKPAFINMAPWWRRTLFLLVPRKWRRYAVNKLKIWHYDGIPLFYSGNIEKDLDV